ncbi:hypothetical protein J8M20_17605 [Pseudoalteromonas luteoviolacea]|uniref:hypothetical protein n=1 Tax=Pseudoalteromonas luteoviolacea TaxID=43657 RepID=UPI001B39673D|nr:hypothetical protein [Pseudoalteromonas luteoviolacea]MBQ4813183.1 hypothetical protein [Pseudoalteromonas luteoviolacea]
MNKTALKPARKIHKYLGYLLALQIFAWLLGGFVMSAIPLDMVHGKHLAQRHLDNPFQSTDYTASLDDLKLRTTNLQKIEFTHFLERPIIKTTGDTIRFFDGQSGMPLTPPTESQIRQQAQAHYLGNAQLASIEQLQTGPREVQYRHNIWRVVYSDWVNTTIYLDSVTGQVITVRSTLWRIFDFFWMLHIMDYDERDDFNNPLLISFSATSVLFCISGMVLLLRSPPWRRRRIQRK